MFFYWDFKIYQLTFAYVKNRFLSQFIDIFWRYSSFFTNIRKTELSPNIAQSHQLKNYQKNKRSQDIVQVFLWF